MKCWEHQENEAVGVCAYCGRAVCRMCAIEIPSGRVVCSIRCSERLSDKYARFKVWVLYGIAALFAASCLVSLLADYYGMAVLMGIAAIITLMAAAYGTSGDSADNTFGELYWRAGMATLDAQTFRQNLRTFIPLYNQLTGENVTQEELGSLDVKARAKKLLDMIALSCRKIGKTPPSVPEQDPFITEAIKYYEVMDSFFIRPDDVFDSRYRRSRAIKDAIRAEWRLRSTNCYLDALIKDIKKHLAVK